MIRRVSLAAALALVLASPGSTGLAQTASSATEGMVGPAIYVSDAERSLRFYTEGLGMTLRIQFGPKDKPDRLIGFGKNPLEAGILLLTDKAGPKPRPIRQAHGFDRITLRVTDLRTVNQRLLAAGFAPGKIEVVHGAVQMMMVADPDGYRIELIDSKPAPHQP